MTLSIDGAGAFDLLGEILRGEATDSETPFAEPSFARLRRALGDPLATELDRAVLIRQVLRFESERRRGAASLRLPISLISAETLRRVGLTARERVPGSFDVEANPWTPVWLNESGVGVDGIAMSSARRRFVAGEEVRGDPFLASIGLIHYRSPGQRAAVRSALAMPPGGKLVVDLPTGEGKSAVFKLIDKVGFSTDSFLPLSGITLVIVPTVTLAIDHERSCGGSRDQPLAYVGGRDEANSTLKAAIAARKQGLCFAAPEAVLGPLLHSLTEAARAGAIRAVIIDEAHLIEAWGTGFRTDFQVLAGQCRRWLDLVPFEKRFRTIFLSATLSASSIQTIRDLFDPESTLQCVSSAKVRPEPDYWVAKSSDQPTQRARVLEALHRLPRPAIVYVTKVSDARDMFSNLRAFGFGRLAVVHGETPLPQRELALQQWAEGTLDLVVATSAFGLGVDYPHVRTIIHACVPETFDRFYQEVGRAGRDGCATVSLLVPTYSDFGLAESLNRQTVISVERGLQRWTAMFSPSNAINIGHPKYRIRLDVAPGYSADDIDLVGERSKDWNARLLVLLVRSGLIRILGPVTQENTTEGPVRLTGGPWFDIEILNDAHLDAQTWSERTQPKRESISQGATISLRLMQAYLGGDNCPGRLASALYGADGRTLALNCSTCPACRARPEARSEEGVVAECKPPWDVGATLAASISQMLSPYNLLVVELPTEDPTKSQVRDFTDALKTLDRYGLRHFVSVGDAPSWIEDSVRRTFQTRPWLVSQSASYSPYAWANGPRIVSFGREIRIESHWVNRTEPATATIALVPANTTLQDQPHRRLIETISGPVLPFWDFVERLLI